MLHTLPVGRTTENTFFVRQKMSLPVIDGIPIPCRRKHYGWDMKQTASIAATPHFAEAYQEQAYYDAVAQVEVDCYCGE